MRKTPNSELQRLDIQAFKVSKKTPIIVLLDNVRSALNIGSIFRTSDAFLVEAVYLCGISAQPPNKDIRKTALGASESVTWKYYKDTIQAIEELKAANYTIIAIEQADKSIDLQDFMLKNNQKYVLIFGHEVKGVSPEVMQMVDACIEIPQYGTKHSLNIAVSAGVVLWDLFVKYQKVGIKS